MIKRLSDLVLQRFFRTDILVFVIVILVLSPPSNAIDIDFKPRAGISYLDQQFALSLQENNSVTGERNLDYNSSYYAFNLGASIIVEDRLAFSISGLSTTEIDSEDINNQLSIETEYKELNASLSYRLTNGLRIIVGGRMNDFNLKGELPLRFKDEGPYLGVSSGVSIGNSAVLAVRGVVAKQKGSIEGLFISSGDENVLLNQSSDVNAFSIGISWNDSINNTFGYTLALDYRALDFELEDVSGNSLFGHLDQKQILLTFALRSL